MVPAFIIRIKQKRNKNGIFHNPYRSTFLCIFVGLDPEDVEFITILHFFYPKWICDKGKINNRNVGLKLLKSLNIESTNLVV